MLDGMTGNGLAWLMAGSLGGLVGLGVVAGQAAPPAEREEAVAEAAAAPAATVQEARARARLLHETIHGALLVMHRDFFDDDQLHSLPSQSLEDVFKELERSHRVEVHWLVVNGKVMNVDHKPRDEFERRAVAALDAGKEEIESVANGRYRRAGLIPLRNTCLKCHVPNRTSLEDRAASLVISMPVKPR